MVQIRQATLANATSASTVKRQQGGGACEVASHEEVRRGTRPQSRVRRPRREETRAESRSRRVGRLRETPVDGDARSEFLSLRCVLELRRVLSGTVSDASPHVLESCLSHRAEEDIAAKP
ncbi:unnamed protein product [Lampetra planeri]